MRLSSTADARSRPNGFSSTTRPPAAQPDCASPCTTVANALGGDREVEGGMARRAERCAQRRERVELGVVAAHIAQPLDELLERRFVDAAAVALDALPRARVDAARVLGIASDRHHGRVEPAALHHRVQRREDLLEGEVARGSEDHERIRRDPSHAILPSGLPGLLAMSAELGAQRGTAVGWRTTRRRAS
jgi:hypothetical protein